MAATKRAIESYTKVPLQQLRTIFCLLGSEYMTMHVDWLMVKAKSLFSNVVLFFAIS